MELTKKEARIESVKTLCTNVIPYFEKTFFNRYIEDYKNYLWYVGDRQSMIDDWQTNIFFPMIPAIVDTMYASMYDSKIKFNVSGDWVKWTDDLLNHAFDYKHSGKDALMDSIKECLITGKWYLKPIFLKYRDKKVVRGIDYGHEVKRPMLDYVSIFNVFYDYNTTLQDSAFTIERYILNRKQILKRYSSKVEKTDNPDFSTTGYIDWILKDEKTERYSEYDINRVRHIIAFDSYISKNNLSTVIPIQTRTQTAQTDNTIEWRNSLYGIDFAKNKVFEVIEYNDDEWTTVLIDGKLLYMGPKQINTDSTIITDINFSKIPWTSDSTWVATNLSELQGITNTLYNIFLDNLKMQMAPMFEQVWGLNQMLGKKNRIKYEPYKVIPTNTPWSMRRLELGIWGFEPINVIQFIESFAEKRSWVNEYIMWGQGKVERIAGWVDLIFNQYKSKLMPLTNSINNAMWYIAKMFLLMYGINFEEKELQELWLVDKLDYKVFLDERNVSFHLSSLSLLSEEEGIKNLTESLKTLSPFLQTPEGSALNVDELVKGILKREVDVDKILQKEKKPAGPVAPWWAPTWTPPEATWDLMNKINNLQFN